MYPVDGKLFLDEDVPCETGEYQNGWFIHTCKLNLTLFCHFLYVYISCGCLTWCLNSKHSSSTRGNTTKYFSRCARCVRLYLLRARIIFLATRRRSSDLFPGYQVASGAQKAHWGTQKEQLLLLLLLLCQDSGLASRPELAVETSFRTLNTSLNTFSTILVY